MLSKVLLLASLASSVLAVPPSYDPCPDGYEYDDQYQSPPTLPRNGGDKELAPPDGLRLLHMVIGVGVQNYTCSDPSDPSSTTPKLTGALAVLWDVLPLYTASPTSDAFAALPGRILAAHKDGSFFEYQQQHSQEPRDYPFPPPAPLDISSVVADGMPSKLSYAGHHYFNERGVPTFVIKKEDGRELRLPFKKDDEVEAPKGADGGPDKTGAVAWLKLSVLEGQSDDETGGVKFLYRVITAGGNSHGCKAGKNDSTSYAATYWFYG